MRALRGLGVVLAGLLVLGALGAGSAFGAYTYSFGSELEASGGSLGALEANSVAVDDGDGRTYVAPNGGGVDVFETASGAQVGTLDGSLTPAGSFAGTSLVAANNATSDVYVLDRGHSVVDVFDASGSYVCQITGTATPSASECNGVAGSDTPLHTLNQPQGVAVDQATGDVYVEDARDAVVDVFSGGGAYLRGISLASIPDFTAAFMRGLAVDDFNGNVYIADSNSDVVHVLNAAGAYVTTWSGANTPASSFGHGFVSVDADNANGDVYVTDSQHQVTDILGPSGEYLSQINPSSINGFGTAIDQANGNLYISDSTEHVVYVWDALVVPDVTTATASNIQPTSVTLNGIVNPDGLPVTSCLFEYGTSTSYGQSAPCVPSPGSGSAPVAVSANISGLVEGTTYHFRLVAANANGPNQGADVEVTIPAPPSIDGAEAENLSAGSVDLHAAIDPHAAPTSYHFEYGTSTAYGASVPVPDGVVAAGLADRAVTQHLSGLQANTTYHWRVVARNLAGTTTGSDHTFLYDTAGNVGLPDNRAYEMVTPPQKNGALIGNVFLGLEQDISESGSRVMLSTLQCFGAAGSCTDDEDKVGTPYAFTRTGTGWAASQVAPSAAQFDHNNTWAVNADTGTALLSMPTLPVGEEDWWGRQSDGSLQHIGPITPPAKGLLGQQLPNTIPFKATADLSHVVYSDSPEWPFDATQPDGPEADSLYEYVGVGSTVPVLVGVSGGAGSIDLISECGTRLGNGLNGALYGDLSADGRTVFFTADRCATGSGVNAGVEVPANAVYARIDESRTVPVSVRSPLDCTSGTGCLGSPPGDALFVGASADGSKVFFLDTQQLTDGASEDSQSGDSAHGYNSCAQTTGPNGCNLYEYDFSRPAGHNLVAVSAGDSSGGGPRVQGVMALSPDGSHVYFVARGVLAGAANERGQTAVDGAENLYVFERDASHPAGHLAFIASLPEADGVTEGRSPVWTGGAFLEDVTPDGRFLVFTSHAALTADASSGRGAEQVFRYDAQTERLVRISIGENGFNDNGNAGVGNASIVAPWTQRLGSVRGDPTMSHDGSYVFFESPVALTPGAIDDVSLGTSLFTGEAEYVQNVYEYHEGHVYLLSDGRDVSSTKSAPPCQEHYSAVCLLGTDATGSNVFFTTADPLVPSDTDTAPDVYDARICTTGEPCIAASPSSAAPCQGDACHGAPGVTPGAVGVATATFSGPGNLQSSMAPAAKAKAKKPKAKKRRPAQRAHGKAKKHKRGKRGARSSGRHGHKSSVGGK